MFFRCNTTVAPTGRRTRSNTRRIRLFAEATLTGERKGGFDARRYRLVTIAEQPARRFVREYHYSHSFPAARMSFGLLEGEHLVGVAVLGVPMHPAVLTKPFPTLGAREAAELSRLVLLDAVPANAESWLLGRLFRLAATEGLRGLVAFSDPLPRILADELLMPGHVGHIDEVTRGRYLGRGTARQVWMLSDGSVLTARAIQISCGVGRENSAHPRAVA